LKRYLALVVAVALTACSGESVARSFAPNAPVAADLPPGENGYIPLRMANAIRPVCPPAPPGMMRCLALERVDLRQGDAAAQKKPLGYAPGDLRAAYNISASSGKGATIGIIAAYGYTTAASDLAIYRSQFHLPPCTTSDGCLKIVNENGGAPPVKTDAGWDFEQALDLDAASAICPKCKLLLVEGRNQKTVTLYTGARTAARAGVTLVSMSFVQLETTVNNDAYFISGPTYVGGSGDSGGGTVVGGPAQPCSFVNVVCVGGTRLTRAANARGWSEVVWNDFTSRACGGLSCGATGSGCSRIVPKPAWQAKGNPSCKNRAAADVSANASPLTPIAIYTTTAGGWTAAGGTSAATPMIAAMIALAGNGRKTNVPQLIWSKSARTNFNDVTIGNNVSSPYGPCASNVIYICKARVGYDGPTGWGTPNGTGGL
jgi:subtilase family serine protease